VTTGIGAGRVVAGGSIRRSGGWIEAVVSGTVCGDCGVVSTGQVKPREIFGEPSSLGSLRCPFKHRRFPARNDLVRFVLVDKCVSWVCRGKKL
jgi:hypothetical protein